MKSLSGLFLFRNNINNNYFYHFVICIDIITIFVSQTNKIKTL